MKIKEIAKVCDGRKRVILVNKFGNEEEGTPFVRQFAGDGAAFYPLDGMPTLDEENILTVFDVPKDKQATWTVEEQDAAGLMQDCVWTDNHPSDTEIKRSGITLCGYGGNEIEPIYTPWGLLFIAIKYLRPLKDAGWELRYFARKLEGAEPMLIAKLGMMAIASVFGTNALCHDKDRAELLGDVGKTVVERFKKWEEENP